MSVCESCGQLADPTLVRAGMREDATVQGDEARQWVDVGPDVLFHERSFPRYNLVWYRRD
jgi:hypothetical protein